VPIDVVGSGIDDEGEGDGKRFRGKHDISGPMILFLARKDPDKGYRVLREAHNLMTERATLVCIGPEPEGRMPTSGAKWPVVELGFIPEEEKRDALAACDVFCVPSLGEAFGLVYMEAGWHRKPIVCRPIPVLEELLHGAAVFVGERVGQCGGKLSPAELVAELDSLLKDKGRREKLGDVARKSAERFLWPNVTKKFNASYEAAIAGGKRSPAGMTGLIAEKREVR